MWLNFLFQTEHSPYALAGRFKKRPTIVRAMFVFSVSLFLATASGCRAKPASLLTLFSKVALERSSEVVAPAVAENDALSPNKAATQSVVSQASYQEQVLQPAIESPATAFQSNQENTDNEGDILRSRLPYESANEESQPRSLSIPAGDSLVLESVLSATVKFYPEIEATVREFDIAQGASIQAHGNFDTKLKASSENTPVGFYETYRSQFGIEKPTFGGGALFAGYRFGRGDIEPWYLERNTNELGELKLGANWALLRGREIDSRRVQLWQANLKRQSVEPLVLNQLIQTLRDAEIAYWNWVAAGQMFQLNQRLLSIAQSRVEGITERIKAGDLAEITKTDNDRSILSREVKLLKAKAKLESAAIKLSLFYRDTEGIPLVPDVSLVPKIGQPLEAALQWPEQDPNLLIASAIDCRPEIRLICLEMKAISLDIAKARNDFLPELNAEVAVSQDFGDPTSASAAASSSTQTLFVNFDEKDEFQLDANLSLSQSLQRRKASGKVRALTGKLQQLHIKRAFLKEKIEAEVQANYLLAQAANEQIQVASRSLELAQKLSDVARQQYEEGDVDLFEIILREKQELDSAVEQIESSFSFHVNRANLNAAVGCVELEALDRLLR